MKTAPDHPDTIAIRPARKADLPVLVDFMARLAAHVSGAPAESLVARERDILHKSLNGSLGDEDKRIVVADAPGTGPVGMGYIAIWRRRGMWEHEGDREFRSGFIDNVWVEPAFRKGGLFRSILRELLAFAHRHDVPELVLEYALSNKEAERTWRKLGFRPTGVRAAARTEPVLEALGEAAPRSGNPEAPAERRNTAGKGEKR